MSQHLSLRLINWRRRGSGCICILDLGIIWRWVVSFTPRPLYPRVYSLWYPLSWLLHTYSRVQNCDHVATILSIIPSCICKPLVSTPHTAAGAHHFWFYKVGIWAPYTGCSERRPIGHSFYRRNFYETVAPLAEKNAASGLSDFSVRGAPRRHFSRQVAQHFRRKFRR
jgi:hypothetical protein